MNHLTGWPVLEKCFCEALQSAVFELKEKFTNKSYSGRIEKTKQILLIWIDIEKKILVIEIIYE